MPESASGLKHSQITYRETSAFSGLAVDYAEGAAALSGFINHKVSDEGLSAAMAAKAGHPVDRALLISCLRRQYAAVDLHPEQEKALGLLASPNTFTITTAHQPNIFTGPLYFIYKILHAIRLAAYCKSVFPDKDFVPVYYMGSEDADLDELGHFFVDGEKLIWPTRQSGAVGRMNTEGMEALVSRLEGQFAHEPYGKVMVDLCRHAYLAHGTIQEATFYLVNQLFRSFGLITLIPDNPALKRLFIPIAEQELTGNFSQPEVEKQIPLLEENYKVQVKGRAINLFYLDEQGRRERIEKTDHGWKVQELGLHFSPAEMQTLVQEHPERISPNVILRGLFQEMLLPNIVFIGGGAEIAYWLELKGVFDKAGVPYPMLVLRNSFLLLNARQQRLQRQTGMSDTELFRPVREVLDRLVADEKGTSLFRETEERKLWSLMEGWQETAAAADPTLRPFVAGLHTQMVKGLHKLDAKLKKAARRNLGERGQQVEKLHAEIFPNGSLQERVENFMPFYARYGPELLQQLLDASPALNPAFTIFRLPG